MVRILTQQYSIASQYLAELRDIQVQKDRLRFRRNLERMGEVMAYEISKMLDYKPVEIETPLGIASTQLLVEQPVILTILRAGVPFHQGFLNVFDGADSGFIASYRHHKKSGAFEIEKQYSVLPDLNNRCVIIVDPMLATGSSLKTSCEDLLYEFNIKELHIASVIASEEGINFTKRNFPSAEIWVGDVDNELTSKSYIVPGLGDAGDLAYGEKFKGNKS